MAGSPHSHKQLLAEVDYPESSEWHKQWLMVCPGIRRYNNLR